MIPGRGASPSFEAILLLLACPLTLLSQSDISQHNNVGCVFSERVCLEDQQCFDDGVLGRCISAASQNSEHLYRSGPISSHDLHLLAAEMKRVLSQDYNWEDDYSQCVFQALVDHINYNTEYSQDECNYMTMDTMPTIDNTAEWIDTREDYLNNAENDLSTADDDSNMDWINRDKDMLTDTRYTEDLQPVLYQVDPEYLQKLQYKENPKNDDLLQYSEIIPLDADNLDVVDSIILPDIIPVSSQYLPNIIEEDDNEVPTFSSLGDEQGKNTELISEDLYPGEYTVHYVPDRQQQHLPYHQLLYQPLHLHTSQRTKRRSSDWVVVKEPDYEEDQQEGKFASYDFDYADSSGLDDTDTDSIYYSTEARFPLETVFDRRERLDVKKPGPFYSNSQNNFFIDKLLGGDYADTSIKSEEDGNIGTDGQTEYEFPLLTQEKQKKSDRTIDDSFTLGYEGVSTNKPTYLVVYVKERLSTLTQATSILTAMADQLHLPLATFGEPKLWPNRVSVTINNNPAQLNASTIAEALNEEVDSVNGRIPAGLDIQVDTFTATNQSDVSSVFTGHSRLFLALFLLTAGISSAILVAGLLLILRTRRGKNLQKELDKEQRIKSEPVKEYKQLVRDWSRSSRQTSQSSNAGGGGVGAPKAEDVTADGAPSGVVGAGDSAAPTTNTQNSEGSRTSSTSSQWNEEPGVTTMDISTGHMVLNYMEDHLNNKQRLEQEWVGLCAYEAEPSATTVAFKVENRKKNRYPDKLPYDHNRVLLNALVNSDNSDYINASTVTDHDPRNPGYIVTQGPLVHTVSDFWQMVWEQGSVVIVMVSSLAENGYQLVHRYWPQQGSETYHIYEVHLVSEHVWCDDYLVRSLYLKNTQTAETRTVTQFHFLAWPDRALPHSTKSLLEFRRKVNKSYRGRSCPIIVHCSDGVGRSGTYVLLDMVLNRISKGSKEIDIAATLEHIRDQRSGMVQTKCQFEFCLTGVAEETHAILKCLAQ